MEAKKNVAEVKLHRTGPAPASGSIVSWQLVPLDSLQASAGPIRIQKKCFVFNETRSNWDLVSPATNLTVGARIKTVLTLETDKPLRYVYIEDKRSAALEPSDVLSGYSTESGLSFYRSIRDVGCQFFCDFIPSGRWQLSYDSQVAHEGEFTSGTASLECMYKPDLNANSNAGKLIVK